MQKLKLSAEAFQLHQQLNQKILSSIQASNGRLNFVDFMRLALYTPELGYYQNNLRKFGELGDFITAPEMGDLFAKCVARSLQTVEVTNILEIGAGSGVFAIDLLKALQQQQRVPQNYFILEPSASLQSLQRQSIAESAPELLNQVTWLSQLPQNFNGIIIANEVLDAIPCQRIKLTDAGWHYLNVCQSEEEVEQTEHQLAKFEWQIGALVVTADLPAELQNVEEYPQGYTTELRPLVDGWITSLGNCLQSGIVLLIDYGYPQQEYYHPQRTDGSLCCFSRHQANTQALELVGLQDITAHVNFTQVAFAAAACGLQVEGFTTQMGYLLENGILEIDSNTHTTNHSVSSRSKHSQQIQKLTTPGQMGELVKVILLSKNAAELPAGFSFQDHLHRL